MIEFLDRPIAFHRSFVKMGIGITGALMLSQSIYWSRRTNSSGWFYKTQEEWQDETGMTRRELDTARKKLRQLGILEEKKQGVPCRVFYRINEPNLIVQMEQTSLAESANLVSTNPPSSAEQNRQTKTETTQRLPETTTKDLSAQPDALAALFEKLWKVYPTKKGKKQALAKFKSIIKGRDESPEQFTDLLAKDVVERVNRRQFGFDKLHLTTYLNQERWTDEHEKLDQTNSGTSTATNRFEQHNQRLLEQYGHTATPIRQPSDSTQSSGMGKHQVCGGIRDEMAPPRATIDLGSGDFHHVDSPDSKSSE
ncbi:hypothetical protein [Vibrio coralliilyticus]|uniref:hypothetical protein n=1 Tax=Vibrio coralliilyticus TaxID=190893 RepID=UPI00345EDF94